MKYLFLLILFSVSLSACHQSNDKLKEALEKAGANKNQFEIVLNHYKETGEKDKYKAAIFLISNMDNKYGRYGDFVRNYFPVINILKKLKEEKIGKDSINKRIHSEWQSIEDKLGPITPQNNPYYPDLNTINSEYLIENIDYAFKAWKEKPWAKHLNFSQFCEFILPYRVFDEPLQFYRKKIYEEYSWLGDSIKDKSNPVEACLMLNSYLAKNFIFCSKLDKLPYPGIMDMQQMSAGICEHRYYYLIMIMRTLGIPVVLEYTPQLNDGPNAHFWMSVIDKDGIAHSFNGGEPDVKFTDKILCPIGTGYTTKVYRNTFENFENKLLKNAPPKDIPSFFRSSNFVDVTAEYDIPQADIKIKVEDKKEKSLYLLCFGMSYNLVPVAVTDIFWNTAKFKNVGLNCVYVPGFFKDNSYEIVGEPFYYSNTGDKNSLTPDYTKTGTIRLTRKYIPQQYIFQMYDYARYMQGAKFQACNSSDFHNAIDLYTVDTSYFHFVEKEVHLSQPYQFYRYLSTKTGPVRIAEVDFMLDESYGVDKSKMYRIMGEAPKDSGVNMIDFKKAFDGNVTTNFNAPAGSWVGMDFGKKVNVEKIRFLVRNDLNIIEIGDTYQLLIFNLGWKILGEKTANKNYIDFENVPDNCILLLRDLTKGKEERIFIYKDGKQLFL